MFASIIDAFRWLADEPARRKTLDLLARMDDHRLSDLGLRRDQLESTVLLGPELAQRAPDLRSLAARTIVQGCG